MGETTAFIKAFLDDPTGVGSVFPSSPAAAARMVKGIKPNENAIVLELGCGTGPFTEAIERILPTPNAFLGIELNEELVNILREKFPHLHIVCGDASKATEIHEESGLGEVKYIVSALPFTSLPEEISGAILAEADKFMRRGGCEFRTIQFATSTPLPAAKKFRRAMNQKYGKAHRSQIVWRNFPPCYILTWRT